MSTPFNYSGQAYDPFNQRVRGQQPGAPQPTPTQPVQAASYPTAPAAPTGAVPGLAPSAPVYQGPPVQSSGYYGQQTTPPAYSQQGSQTPGPTQGWPTAPQQQYQTPGINPYGAQPPNYQQNQQYVPPGQYQQQHPGGITGGITGKGYQPQLDNQPSAQQPQFSPQAMPGWDQGKWQDPGKHDAKYDAGRLMSTLAPSVANIPQVLGMLQQAGHQVQYGGGDTAVIDGFTVDLVQGSHSGNPQWQWMVPQGAPAPEQQTGGIDPYTAMFMQMMGGGAGFQGPPVQTQAPATGGADQTQLLQAIMQLLQNQASAPRGPVAPNFSFY